MTTTTGATYDADNQCTRCGEHLADPHAPNCPHTDDCADRCCTHPVPCPAADAADHTAAHVIAAHPEQGWSLLCNGVIMFDDGGELDPGDCHATGAHRGPSLHIPAPTGYPVTVTTEYRIGDSYVEVDTDRPDTARSYDRADLDDLADRLAADQAADTSVGVRVTVTTPTIPAQYGQADVPARPRTSA